MTEKTRGRSGIVEATSDPASVSMIVDKSLRPGSNVSFGLPAGTLSVTLDHSGDWTIMVGLSTKSEGIVSTMFTVERLGFFKATETEGTAYFLWTSALEDAVDVRGLVEAKLFETLRALQRTGVTRYIC